jgi:hypothetical protein
VADDRDSWGKTTTQPWELATREESPNGGAERWLAGSEGAVAAYLNVGKTVKRGGSLDRSVAFIPRRRERGVCGLARRRSDAGVEPDRQSQARVGFPLLRVADG